MIPYETLTTLRRWQEVMQNADAQLNALFELTDCNPDGPLPSAILDLMRAYTKQTADQLSADHDLLEDWCWEHDFGAKPMRIRPFYEPWREVKTVEDLAEVIKPTQKQRARDSAALDVLTERHRQIEAEGWTHEHDDAHDAGELAAAAACYAIASAYQSDDMSMDWPWHADWWKPTDERRNLIKAGALILAEIERLDRKKAASC